MAVSKHVTVHNNSDTTEKYALIGAGPMGLACAKVLAEQSIPFQGFERHTDIGGLWDIENPASTMYETAHLISSKHTTEFTDYPMRDDVAEYPSHREILKYFHEFADHYALRDHFNFGCEVLETEPLGDSGAGWRVCWRDGSGAMHEAVFAGLLIANGTLSDPNRATFDGDFSGEIIHSSAYRYPRQFKDKRVLIVGAGNSGCDIAIDAVHHGKSCDISVRRGYHFVPKYLFGKPADTLSGSKRLPMWLKRRVDLQVLKWFVGDPEKYGFPKPDYLLYQSHPVVNSLILFHAGHGDVKVRADISHLDKNTVHFMDGSQGDYDLILLATGYQLNYPFIDRSLLNWQHFAPHLYLNCMHPTRDDLFVMGMVEATGLGWQGRHEQAELVARFIGGQRSGNGAATQLQAEKKSGFERLTAGMDYLDIPRMAYYVDKDSYRSAVVKKIRALSGSDS